MKRMGQKVSKLDQERNALVRWITHRACEIITGLKKKKARWAGLENLLDARSLLGLEGILDRGDYLRGVRLHAGLEPGDDLAVAAHQKLGEVPVDIARELRVLAG